MANNQISQKEKRGKQECAKQKLAFSSAESGCEKYCQLITSCQSGTTNQEGKKHNDS